MNTNTSENSHRGKTILLSNKKLFLYIFLGRPAVQMCKAKKNIYRNNLLFDKSIVLPLCEFSLVFVFIFFTS
jgi:hypothetical protein